MWIGRPVDFIAAVDAPTAFQPFGLAHLIVIGLTISLPFILATFVRKSRWPRSERIVGQLLAGMLLINYLGFEIYLAATAGLEWKKVLPFQLCDWAMISIIVGWVLIAVPGLVLLKSKHIGWWSQLVPGSLVAWILWSVIRG